MLQQLFHDAEEKIEIDGVVIVGHREPNDTLYQSLMKDGDTRNPSALSLIGDALAPGAIVHAVHSGHLYARGLLDDDSTYLRDEPVTLPRPASAYIPIPDSPS